MAWVTYDQVLGEFGVKGSISRRAYTRFVRAGVEKPPPSPFAEAREGMLLGSDTLVARIGRRLDDRPTDHRVPQLEPIRRRPPLEAIIGVVGEHFLGLGLGFRQDTTRWSPGRRSDDASRAVAAYLARRRFGYPATEVAQAPQRQSRYPCRRPGGVEQQAAETDRGETGAKATLITIQALTPKYGGARVLLGVHSHMARREGDVCTLLSSTARLFCGLAF